MKRAKYAVVLAIVVALASCGWLDAGLSPEDVGGALAVAAREASLQVPMSQLSVSPGAPLYSTATLSGSSGGSATYTFDYTDPGVSGSIAFEAFAFETDDGDEYVIDGEVNLDIAFDPQLDATYTGAVTIAKNGEAALEYDVDIVLTVAVDTPGDGTYVLTVTSTGAVNGQDANGEFTVTLPAGPVAG